MRVTTSKSKNSESFYITKGFINEKGVSTSSVVRKLGTLNDLLKDHGPTRDDVMAWAREQARLETEKYKKENEARTVLIPFHADRQLDYGRQKLYKGGYLFLQSVYYGLGFDRACRKIRERHKFRYDLNAILSDLIYTRILEPGSKRASYRAAMDYLEKPSYEEHDVYRALDVLAEECGFIQSEAFKNSSFLTDQNDGILYYDCTNYYFEIEQEGGAKKYGKSKEHRPNPIVQMGLFTDGDGIPLAFSIFPGNQNEQQSLKPLEKTILQKFGHSKFIYCCDAGLGSEGNREFNHMGERSFIVTQSIKKLPAEDREWALNGGGFKRLSDDKPVELSQIGEEKDGLFYKDCPYTTKKLHQRLIITYSPKYAAYQKEIRRRQVERAERMVASGERKAERKNPNDPARFVGKMAATKAGEAAGIQYYLDEERIAEEARYDGLYAVCTDLLDDDVAPILKVSEGRRRIEECFRIMKTDFEARPAFVCLEDRIEAHFLTCFLALLVYRILEKKLGGGYTCEEILKTLREMDFADVEEQGYMPLYKRSKLTDALHEACGFRTDYQFITRQKMRGIQKRSKGRE